MNPEDFKFKFKDIDLKDFYDSKLSVDYDFFKKYCDEFDWNLSNTVSSTAVKSSFSDMNIVIGVDHNGQMHIIKNERGDEGLKYININVIMRMFIQALRTGINVYSSIKNRYYEICSRGKIQIVFL